MLLSPDFHFVNAIPRYQAAKSRLRNPAYNSQIFSFWRRARAFRPISQFANLSGNTPLPMSYFASYLGTYGSYLSFEKYEMNFPNVGKHKTFFSKFTKYEIYFANLQNSGYMTKNKIWRDQYVKYFSSIRLQIRDENLHRQKSRKPSLEAFSQSRTVASIEPSIATIDDIFLKRFL